MARQAAAAASSAVRTKSLAHTKMNESAMVIAVAAGSMNAVNGRSGTRKAGASSATGSRE